MTESKEKQRNWRASMTFCMTKMQFDEKKEGK
jgi:hypothetical protein